jgi:hypothetical protein
LPTSPFERAPAADTFRFVLTSSPQQPPRSGDLALLQQRPPAWQGLKALGADGAVQKPFDIPALITQIRGHLGAERGPR